VARQKSGHRKNIQKHYNTISYKKKEDFQMFDKNFDTSLDALKKRQKMLDGLTKMGIALATDKAEALRLEIPMLNSNIGIKTSEITEKYCTYDADVETLEVIRNYFRLVTIGIDTFVKSLEGDHE
jgi:hypothetical protein